MPELVFEQYAKQIDMLQVFQLEILKKKIDTLLYSRKKEQEASLSSDFALFEHFSGIGAGIDADSAKRKYFEDKYGSLD